MATYCINSNPQPDSGDYEVHRTSQPACIRLPLLSNQVNLGEHTNCHLAVSYVKQQNPSIAHKIDGCYWCINECHNH